MGQARQRKLRGEYPATGTKPKPGWFWQVLVVASGPHLEMGIVGFRTSVDLSDCTGEERIALGQQVAGDYFSRDFLDRATEMLVIQCTSEAERRDRITEFRKQGEANGISFVSTYHTN